MKKILFILLITLATTILHAQDVYFKWAKQMGGSGSNSAGNSIAVDASGNVFTTGSFTGTLDFDPGPGVFNLIAVGSGNTFVSKLNAAGNFVWAKQMGGTGSAYGSSISLDATGNIYTTGAFGGIIDFDPGVGVFNLGAATGSGDCFVSKLDACGNFVWAKKIGGNINDHAEGNSITVDASGNVYTIGSFYGTEVDFDPGPGVYILNSSYGVEKIFVSKLDATGNFVWSKQMVAILDGAAIFGSYGRSIAVDASGNVYTTGYFGGTVDFDPGPGVFYLSTVYGDNFISKIDAAGNYIWARQMGQTTNSFVWGNSIAVNASGNVYTSGIFYGTVDFDPGPGVFNLSTISNTISNANIFVSKLNAAGNFAWAKQIGGTGSMVVSSLFLDGSSISLDAAGSVFTTGTFSGSVDFDPGGTVFNLSAAGNGDIFVSKLDLMGNFVWAKQMGGAGSGYGSAISLDATGNIYTTGAFNSTIDFDPGLGVYNLTSVGTADIFIHKMSHCTNNNNSSTITVSACSSYTWNCQVYTASGVYTQILVNAAGCDSIITLNLTIGNTNPTFTFNAVACNSYIWNGQILTNSGTYTDTLVAANGCDSIVTLQLAIKPKSFSAINETICQGQNYSGYTAGGTYVDTLIATNGCDSIRTLQLTVLPKPVPDLGADKNLCSGDSLILYPGQFATYTWQNGSTLSLITVKQAGLYSVDVIDNCGSARDEIMITETNCDIYFPSAFTPNNDGKNDLFKILGGYNLNDFHLVVYNRWGQKVFETFDYAKGWDGSHNEQLQSSATFVWYCEFNKQGNAGKTKMKGTVTLIR